MGYPALSLLYCYQSPKFVVGYDSIYIYLVCWPVSVYV